MESSSSCLQVMTRDLKPSLLAFILLLLTTECQTGPTPAFFLLQESSSGTLLCLTQVLCMLGMHLPTCPEGMLWLIPLHPRDRHLHLLHPKETVSSSGPQVSLSHSYLSLPTACLFDHIPCNQDSLHTGAMCVLCATLKTTVPDPAGWS